MSIAPSAAQAADTEGPVAFFQAQHQGFLGTFTSHRAKPDLLDRIWMQAFTSFERNVEDQTRDLPALACRKGCGTCCQILVAATAPEVLMVARYVRGMAAGFKTVGIDLVGRLYGAANFVEPSGDLRPMALTRECPFLAEGICVVYPVRPLACRGHASFNEEACVSALKGGLDDVPVSEPHRTVRGLVQNALQSAMRDAGFAWGLYDLVAALKIALARPDAEAEFAQGGDPFAAVAIDAVSREEMASAFDRLKS
ncbi:YkgJ family cysteine cluster protein [Xanthobacter sp. V4C-4]|uniref:YkgJ family cysteine cluster protein n=1 Tax=Xanthobacter cornucopiae TaxID=3119924 RepID=UPI003728E365